jgi:hypothetical protein
MFISPRPRPGDLWTSWTRAPEARFNLLAARSRIGSPRSTRCKMLRGGRGRPRCYPGHPLSGAPWSTGCRSTATQGGEESERPIDQHRDSCSARAEIERLFDDYYGKERHRGCRLHGQRHEHEPEQVVEVPQEAASTEERVKDGRPRRRHRCRIGAVVKSCRSIRRNHLPPSRQLKPLIVNPFHFRPGFLP